MADDNDLNINIGADSSAVKPGTDAAKEGIKSVASEARQLEGAFKRIKTAIDPTFAAQQKYNKALEDSKRLLAAERITKDEARKATQAAKVALDQEIAAIERGTVAGKAAAAERKRRAQEERNAIAAELQASRQAAKEKAAAAREAAAAVEAAQRRETNAIKLSAQAARQAALEAKRLASQAANPSTRGVGAGSVPNNGRSIAQLANDSKRASDAAAAAAVRAMEAAARAAESTSARTARAAENAAQKAREAAENAATRAITLARARASEEGRINNEAAAEAKAAREIEKRATREAAQEAARAAKDKRAAERDVIRVRKEAAEAAKRQAQAERAAGSAAQDLRASIDPAYASQMRYNETMRIATQLLMDNKLKTGEWAAIQKQARAQQDLNVRSLGQQNAMYVQLGYQAQDVTASLASGISPLVILAQQGGQTAAALSTMGGTIGKVAAFMAGPWGAAIIGFTLLIGYLTSATKEEEKAAKDAEEAELDLHNAQKVRTASLEDLTAAIKKFNEEQEEATKNTWEQAESDYAAAKGALARALALRQLTAAQLAQANADYDSMKANMNDENPTVTLGSQAQIIAQRAEEAKAADQAVADAKTALDNVEIQRAQHRAEIATDERKAVEDKYNREEALAIRSFNASKKTKDDLKKLDAELLRVAKAREAAEEGITKQNREQNKVKKERTARPVEDINRAADLARSRGLKVGTIGPNGVSTGPGHRQGRAVDINYIGGENTAAAQAAMDKYALDLQKMGYTVLWNNKRYASTGGITTIVQPKNAKGDWRHVKHLHVEAPEGGAFMKGSSDAGNDAERDLQKLREDALKNFAEDIDYRQELARDDFNEQLRLQDEKLAAYKEFYGEESREYIRTLREKERIGKQQREDELQQTRQNLQTQQQLAQARADMQDQLNSANRGQRSDNIDFNERNGLISARQALMEKAQLLDQEYQDQVAHERRLYELRVQALRDQLALANLPPAEKRRINADIEIAEAEHQNNMTLMSRNYARDVNQVGNEAASMYAGKWREVANTISQSLGQSFQGIWTHSQTAFGAIIQLADQLVFKMWDAGMKIVEDWAVAQFTKKAITDTAAAGEVATVVAAETAKTTAVGVGEGIRTAAKTAGATTEGAIIAATTSAKVASEGIKSAAAVGGAATQVAASAGAGMAQISTLAATSAAGAYSSTVVIPFIGPVAAPVAAAGALAAVLGFGALIASARGGQERVPYDGQMTELHKDEMVLPARIANPLRDSLQGMGPKTNQAYLGAKAMSQGALIRERTIERMGSGVTYGDTHVTIPLSAIDTQSGAQFLMKNKRVIAGAVEDAVRKGFGGKKS